MWTLLAVRHILRKRIARQEPHELQYVAARIWEIAPGETVVTPPAFFLPGQLDRVTGWAFASAHPRPEMEGGLRLTHAPTRGFLLRDAVLLDGALYKGSAVSHLSPRTGRVPRVHVEEEIARAAVFCTPGGNKYFGQWLMDDCPTYILAAAEGTPVTTATAVVNEHARGYEAWLDMKPTRLRGAFLREAVIFEDVGQNRNKHARFRAMSDKLTAHASRTPHPGVFILRGRSGERRVLSNEMELAEYLRDRRGFRIVDPTKLDVPTLVTTCAGSRVVMGVEGSGLIHGILVLPEGGAVLTLQPPNRFVSLYKHLTDRDHQHFGFVVGTPQGDDFRIDPTEVERTLDLFPQAVAI